MKKFVIYLIAFIGSGLLSAQPVITMIVDGTCSGYPKVLEIYANGTVDFSQYALQQQTNYNTTWGSPVSLADLGTVTNDYVYVYYDGTNDNFLTEFPSAQGKNAMENSVINLNGDDRIRLVDSQNNVIDQYGEDGVQGDNTFWDYTDSYAKRNAGVGPNSTFTRSEWTFGGRDALDNKCSTDDGTALEFDIPGGIQSWTLSLSNEITAGWRIYPNPARNTIYISGKQGQTMQVTVYDITGTPVLFRKIKSGSAVDISRLAGGIYPVKVEANGQVKTFKLVIP